MPSKAQEQIIVSSRPESAQRAPFFIRPIKCGEPPARHSLCIARSHTHNGLICPLSATKIAVSEASTHKRDVKAKPRGRMHRAPVLVLAPPANRCAGGRVAEWWAGRMQNRLGPIDVGSFSQLLTEAKLIGRFRVATGLSTPVAKALRQGIWSGDSFILGGMNF